jgi:hypothetical protein
MSLSVERASSRWSYETFGGVDVGNRRRRSRLIAVASAVAARPAGTVAEVLSDSAEREGAYRLLSNESVPAAALTHAMAQATAQACAAHRRVYAATDGSSLSLRDRLRARGLGRVGTRKSCGQGLQVITALALDAEGIPLGVLAQTWWARSGPKSNRPNDRRKLQDKETRFMVSTADEALTQVREHCPQTRVILLEDRGFDCWPVLRSASQGAHFIVRAQHNRRLADGPNGVPRYLLDTLHAQPVRGRYDVQVPQRGETPARVARMHVQTARVTLRLPVARKRREYVDLHVVLAREVDGPPGASLSWMLLTTEPIDTFAQVLEIVRAYTFRWRIEEMHRAWKKGGGHVEDTQLRSREAIVKWATIHVAVATRALRLTQLARTRPETPSSQEFSQTEIDATIALRKKRTTFKFGDVPPLGELVRMIADVGGYTGKSSGGPPGATVIARGLERMGIAAEVIEAMQKK